MKKWLLVFCVLAGCRSFEAYGSWFWSDDDENQPRLSELMEPASELIDDASDLASDGKYQDAVAKYREALDELAKVESAHPDRAASTEFTSLRNKRAYVNAAIDTLLLAEARNNAKAVAITDTTELEKKFLRRKGLLPPEEQPVAKAPEEPPTEQPEMKAPEEPPTEQPEMEAPEEPPTEAGKPETPAASAVAEAKPAPAAKAAQPEKCEISKLAEALKKEPKNRRLRLALIGEYVKAGEFDRAKPEIDRLLAANMTDSAALNLKAVCEASRGDFAAAEKTLDFAIQSHPRDCNGYYNMANLKLQVGNLTQARYYYETGRAVGGPRDAELEAAVAE